MSEPLAKQERLPDADPSADRQIVAHDAGHASDTGAVHVIVSAQDHAEAADSGEGWAKLPLQTPSVGAEMLSCPELARRYSVKNAEALRKRLVRWMPSHQDDWTEVTEHRPREPKYLYRVNAVLPIIQALQASGEASGERPAK